MMRVTGGILGGRRVAVPRAEVRPTQDRVREALFSALGERVPGCRFLDLFAGSGVVGLEAWSRGAARVVWVEQQSQAAAVLTANVTELCRPQGGINGETRIVRAEVFRFLERGLDRGPFDAIFADPPYDRDGSRRWAERLLQAPAMTALLAEGGILILEQAAREPAPAAPAWRLSSERRYGETLVRFFLRRQLAGGGSEP